MAKQEKAKLKVGQKVWYIADGYIAVGFVQAVFVDRNEQILVSISSPKFSNDNGDCKYVMDSDNVLHQDSVYRTKELLVNYVKKVEDDTLED